MYRASGNRYLQIRSTEEHSKPRYLKCDECDFNASQNGAANRHIKDVHNRRNSFKCDECDYSGSRKEFLKKQ